MSFVHRAGPPPAKPADPHLTVVSPPWPIRAVFFDLPQDDGAGLTEVASYARSHPDRMITIQRGAGRTVLPVNVQAVERAPTASDVDLVVSSTKAVVDQYRRRNTFAVLLGGGSAASATMDDLIDDILPVTDQPEAATCSSSDTNARPSRPQSNWAHAAS